MTDCGYLILNLFFTASRPRKISTALSGTCTKDSRKLLFSTPRLRALRWRMRNPKSPLASKNRRLRGAARPLDPQKLQPTLLAFTASDHHAFIDPEATHTLEFAIQPWRDALLMRLRVHGSNRENGRRRQNRLRFAGSGILPTRLHISKAGSTAMQVTPEQEKLRLCRNLALYSARHCREGDFSGLQPP
jgi:hypothetical protein